MAQLGVMQKMTRKEPAVFKVATLALALPLTFAAQGYFRVQATGSSVAAGDTRALTNLRAIAKF